jgi:hypothetical protein
MSETNSQLDEIVHSLAALRQEVRELSARLEALEANSPVAGASVAGDAVCHDELIATISAAVAAFLGEKPRIRQIRLLGSATWSQQGRATIQASHVLASRHH